ncbi:MAG: cobalamin biosynthesis protein, partial [Rhodothalassiaceae bacterium]
MTADSLPLADVSAPATLLLALALNLALCSASRVNALLASPASAAARLIRTLEARYNRPHATEKMRRADSVSVAIVLLLAGLGFGVGLSLLLRGLPYGWIVAAAFIAMMLNLRPQLERMRILAKAMRDGSPEEARATLGLITGRDACEEGVPGICKAGIESTAMALAQGEARPDVVVSVRV